MSNRLTDHLTRVDAERRCSVCLSKDSWRVGMPVAFWMGARDLMPLDTLVCSKCGNVLFFVAPIVDASLREAMGLDREPTDGEAPEAGERDGMAPAPGERDGA